MQFTTEHTSIQAIIQEAQRFTSTRSFASPAFSGIHFSVSGSTLTVRASSGQSDYVSHLLIEDGADGECLVPAGLLVPAIKSLRKGPLLVSLSEGQFRVQQGRARFDIAPLAGLELPAIAPLEDPIMFVLPTEKFAQESERVLVAASADETKPVLTALALEMQQPNALVATDGFRLYLIELDLALNADVRLLLPARIVREVLGLIDDKAALLSVEYSRAQQAVRFFTPRWSVRVNVIQGDYPPYRAIIPDVAAFSFQVDREELLQAVRQAMIFGKDKSSIVVFAVENEELVVSSHGADQGRSHIALPLSGLTGQPERFACNGRFVVDFLNSIESLSVEMRGTEALRPVLLSVPDKPGLMYVVMPFKLSGSL